MARHLAGVPYAFQAVGLPAFLTLMVAGWGQHAPPGVNAKLYAKTNLVTLVVWGIWWPAMIWAAALLGRAWCAVCLSSWSRTEASGSGAGWASGSGRYRAGWRQAE
jgi:hypothetical protein